MKLLNIITLGGQILPSKRSTEIRELHTLKKWIKVEEDYIEILRKINILYDLVLLC